MDPHDLTTILGVAGATTATVQAVKTALSLTGHWVLLVVALAAAVWTFLASQVFGTLQGDYLTLSLAVLVSAMGSVANYEAVLPLLRTILGGLTARNRAALVLLALMLSVGCAAVDADRARYEAMAAPVDEYKLNHPEQAQTYTDLMRAWERSIEQREQLRGGGAN